MRRVTPEPQEPITTYTRSADYEDGFPQNLLIVPQRQDIPDYAIHSYRQHNKAVAEFAAYRVGTTHELHDAEIAMMSLFHAVNEYIKRRGYFEDECPAFEWTFVVMPLLGAAEQALNDSCGRLVPATLHAWLLETAKRIGWNLETGDPL